MPFTIEKLFINIALLLLLITLFISANPSQAADLHFPDRFLVKFLSLSFWTISFVLLGGEWRA